MARSPRSSAIKAIANYWAEDAMRGLPESPEFYSVQRLTNEFQSHAKHEEQWLSDYQGIAKEASDPLIRFLLGLIVADEQRHHELMSRMITKLKDELAWTRAEGLTRRVYEKAEKRKQLLASVERFLEAERTGIKEYEQLKKESQGLYRDVFALLYTTMVHDSHKHIGILEFLRRKLRERERAAGKRKSGSA
jgi:rubrerythrin